MYATKLRSAIWRVAPAWRCGAAWRSRACGGAAAARGRALCTQAADSGEQSALHGTATRDAIHSAFAKRAADALRYEYFAQRAELEAEVEAAHMFRSLLESSKQQAMGLMELMEEYDDAQFGTTLNNLEIMADDERTLADVQFFEAADAADKEQLTHIKEWFEDLSDAATRAANRLEFTAGIVDAEALDGDTMEDDDDDEEEELEQQKEDQSPKEPRATSK